MIILDSSAIIQILNGTRIGKEIKDRYMHREFISATTSISINEVLIGIKENKKEDVKKFFKELEILDFGSEAAYKSVEIEEELRKKGKLINKLDIYIASICLIHNIPIITLDKDFNNIEGLKVNLF